MARDGRPMLSMIWSVLRPRWAGLLVVLLLIPVGTLLELVHPFILRRVVDQHLKVGAAEGLGLLATLYALTFVAVQGVSFLQTYVATAVGQNALRDLRIRLFRRLGRLPISYFDRTPVGDTISRCTSDVDAVGMLFSSTLLGVFSELVRLGGIVAAMLALSPRLTLVALIAVPIVALVSRWFRRPMLAAERATRLRIGETNAQLQETLTGMEVIRAFQQEETFQSRFRRTQDGFLRAADRSGLYDSIFSPLIETLKALSIALLLWYGTRPEVFLSWSITLGTLAAFVQLLERFFGPITSLGQEYQTVQQAAAGVERIFEVLNLPVEQRPPAHPIPPLLTAPDVKVSEVRFGYVPGQLVLKGIALRIEPGEHVAVVGQTGAGKSSLIHLVAGLYAPEAGTLRVGGVDPYSLAPEQRRRLVGVVPQQVHIFEGTVLDNLRLGEDGISTDEVWAALGLANAGDLVRGLPDGLDTPMGASGLRLSSGQCQLLALARALV
ncbi:MAG: ABC transporter ATP-binding protein, partial [Candidatus Latescibacteria bacterium]|nr:ABC transporter ATP-binding protein [Candidatus Latescibacterota bacterium]